MRGDDGDVDAVWAGVGGPGRGGGADAREVRGDGVEAVVGGDAGGGAVGAAVGGGWRVVEGRWLSWRGRGEALLLGVVVVLLGVVVVVLLGVAMLGVVLLGVVVRVLRVLRRMRLALGMMCGVDVGERVRGHLALLVAWLRGWTGGQQEERVKDRSERSTRSVWRWARVVVRWRRDGRMARDGSGPDKLSFARRREGLVFGGRG